VRRAGSFWLRILVEESQIATAPMGTLTKKIQRQPTPLVSTPPTSGPIATRAAHGGAPRRDRLAARRALEVLGDERETGREHRCTADALKGARPDEHGDRLGDAAEQ
jgi:hypothetical protein